MYKNKEIGNLGERIATEYLINQDYYILEKNFRCKLGEIDIIAIDKIDKNELVFIEVKTRFQDYYGTPSDSVNNPKINHLYKAAAFFLMINNLENRFIRFDVIEIYKKTKDKLHINHIKNAIQENQIKF